MIRVVRSVFCTVNSRNRAKAARVVFPFLSCQAAGAEACEHIHSIQSWARIFSNGVAKQGRQDGAHRPVRPGTKRRPGSASPALSAAGDAVSPPFRRDDVGPAFAFAIPGERGSTQCHRLWLCSYR
jgi:hypothetical protein